MNGLPPLITPAPKRTGWIVFGVIAAFFLLVSVLANFVLLALLMGDGMTSSEARGSNYQEEFLQGDVRASDKIAVIELAGVIGYDRSGDGDIEGMVGRIKDQLDRAIRDKRVKAIILRINSPGGEVVASDALYRTLAEARLEKPIVACIETVGASGAYYAAMGSTYVMASDMAITGSIGVILQTLNFRGLMDKVGIQAYTFKSGALKDILNPTRAPTEAETNLVQGLIMEVYDKFVGIVANERHMSLEGLKTGLADGRILSGTQALEAGFIDGLGTFETAVNKAKELGATKKARVVAYRLPFTWGHLLRLVGKSDATRIQIQLSPEPLKLESGKLYFLPAYMFQ